MQTRISSERWGVWLNEFPGSNNSRWQLWSGPVSKATANDIVVRLRLKYPHRKFEPYQMRGEVGDRIWSIPVPVICDDTKAQRVADLGDE